MSPSLLQLQSIGLQDVYLTKDPQINIFKYNYYRYVNFASEVLKLPLNENATFNKKITCDILKQGHLLSKLYLHIQLPPLTKNGGTYASWTDTLGYAIFSEPIELEVGGVVIDRLYPQFMDMWDELSNSTKKLGKSLMILKSDVYTASMFNATQVTNLMIPLDFWFTKDYSLALPILNMQYQDIKINFKLRDFSKLVNYDGSEPDSVQILDSNLFAEYIYLDDVILEQFKNQTHMYIIDQVQYNEQEIISSNNVIYNSTLKFNHPVKELLFCCAVKDNVTNNNYFAYSNTDGDSLVNEVALFLDGKRRFDYLPEFYYRCMFPDSIHSTIPLKHIYCIPFGIKPEEKQPSGSLNFSRFNDVTLSLRMASGNPDCYLYVYALSYNVLKIENGFLSLEFAT